MEETSATSSDTSKVAEATTSYSTRPSIPDREAFQKALREYNQEISDITHKIDDIVGRNNFIGFLNILKQRKVEPRERREQLKQVADQMKIEINEIKKQLVEKDKLQSDIENDLVYRDESRLTARLNELENAYSQTKFTSNRAEKALIKEIDKLKRNQTKLAKYNIVREEKLTIQLKLRGMNERRSNVLKSIREKTNELHAIDEEIRQHRRSLLQLKDCFRELCARKKELVDKYNMERKEYSDWCTANKKKISYNCFVDEETLEPFYEQKMDCKRLIEYLSSLQSRMTVAEISAPANKASEKLSKHVADESDDSAEEYPESFMALKKQSSLPLRTPDGPEVDKETSFITNLKKKIGKKSTKKPCQKISHPVQMVCLFKETGVPIPLTYREIESTLKIVSALLKHYQEQTNIIVWEESDYIKLPTFSESEHTADSAWNGSTDMSERGSTYGFMHVSSSSDLILPMEKKAEDPPTNSCYNQVLGNIASVALSDEGIDSKSSTR